MASETNHPSYLELDRAALGATSPTTQLHLYTCSRCLAYVCKVREHVPAPPWLNALRQPESFWRRWRLPLATFGSAVAVASLAAVLIASPASRDDPAIRSKGAPSVTLFVKRGDTVSIWNGQSPIAAGDRLRLKIAPEGLRNVAVATTTGGKLRVLYRGTLEPKGETLLPESWRVDDSPGPESLAIVLSRDPISEPALVLVVRDHPRTPSVWTSVLTMPKSAPMSGGH